MKSRFQKRNLRRSKKQSIRRKIQNGGMKVEDAIKLLTSYGCGVMEAASLTSAMTKGGKVDDAVLHATVFLHTQHKKSWTDALMIALPNKGNLDVIKLFLQNDDDRSSMFKTAKEPLPSSRMGRFMAIQVPKLGARPHPGGVPPEN
jgi:hypothetical protein